MASDPRFDPYGNEGVEPKQPRSKWTTCLIGCLVVSGVGLIICIAIGVLGQPKLARMGGRFRTDRRSIKRSIHRICRRRKRSKSKSQVDRVDQGFREGKISVEQVGMIVQNVDGVAADAVDRRDDGRLPCTTSTNPDLNDEEKRRRREITLQRFARGMFDEKINEQGIDAVMTHVADRQARWRWQLRQRSAMPICGPRLTEAKAQADAAGIPERAGECRSVGRDQADYRREPCGRRDSTPQN